MANIINLDKVSKSYGAAGQLLTDVSLGLDDTDRVGVVGLNGAGKSTLLRLLMRVEAPDSGRVTHRRDLRVLSLPQALDLAPTATVRDVVVGEGVAAGGLRRGARVGRRFRRSYRPVWTWHAPPRASRRRSGRCPAGERRRVALAAAAGARLRPAGARRAHQPPRRRGRDLAGRHLLARRRGPLVVVTHDRWFLDAVCDADLGGRRRARCAPTTAATRPACWPGRSGTGWRRPPRPAGRTCCARSSPGCAAGRRRAPPSRSSASTPPTRSSPT